MDTPSATLYLQTLWECMCTGWVIRFPSSYFKDSFLISNRAAVAFWYLKLSKAAVICNCFNTAAFWHGEVWQKGKFSDGCMEESMGKG